MASEIPEGITKQDVLKALHDIDNDVKHKFAASTKYDLVHNNRRYPPKAVVGLAARRILGADLGPSDFTGGEGSRCFRVLRGLGFRIELKDETLFQPTADYDELVYRTMQLRQLRGAAKPKGNQTPETITGSSTQFERDPAVRAWVLNQADGKCELCGSKGPFQTDEGDFFLEVHHVVPLAEDGPDVIENAVALCPNCHRRCHLSIDRASQTGRLYNRIGRLISANQQTGNY